MIDFHTHLVNHGERRRFSVADVRRYADVAAERGLAEIAITEHLFRFPDVQDVLGEWWADEPDGRLRAQTERYLADERLMQRLGEYVEVVREGGREADVPVRVGLEVDLFPGRMADVIALLAEHEWDVLVGAVHWIGAWSFDNLGDRDAIDEWHRRDPDDVWLAYVALVEELAASGACDVLAHVDLPKLGGVRPVAAAAEVEERLVKAAASNGLVVEINTNGLRKPVRELYPSAALLSALRASGVAVTLASDAHGDDRVGDRVEEAAALARDAGYTHVVTFEARMARTLALAEADA